MSGYKINFNQDFSAPDLSQFGLIGSNQDDDDNDSDLEAELAALTSGQSKSPAKKPKTKSVVKQSELDRMVAESLKDINDDDISDGDDDPNLLNELQELTGDDVETEEIEESQNQEEIEDSSPKFEPTTTTSIINLLNERIEMYKIGEQNAKAANEASKARRFNRALKTLQDLLKQAKAGKTINNEDIPPEIAIKTPSSQADDNANDIVSTSPKVTPTSPVITPTSNNDPQQDKKSDESSVNPKLVQLKSRQQEYKIAALQAKRNDEIENAKQFVQIIKQFDAVIKMAENGEPVDLSDMPPPPDQLKEFLAKLEAGEQPTAQSEPSEVKRPAPPPPIPSPENEPKNLLGALEHRLNIYKAQEEAAKNENNSSKARRFGRIVKQYQDAITMHKRGKPIASDELPIPPGYGPLPTGSGQGSTASTGASTPAESAKTSPAKSPTVVSPEKTSTEDNNNKKTPPKRELTTRISGNQVSTNLAERQMQILLERQAEFKKAAVEAKKGGELEQAKEYLKIYKGFESLLNAASNGLPVDLSTLPIPPTQRGQLEDSFAIVSAIDCEDIQSTGDGNDDNDEVGMSIRLEEQLAKQLMMCKNTRDHHRAMGDVAGMNRFENLALTVQKELDLIRFSRKKNIPIPKFHYEKRSFNIVHCNTDLNDNEIEVNIIRGISYNVKNPKDVDTYIMTEFPYPIDSHFTAKTSTIKNTASPDYDQKYIIEIQRSNRQCQRIFKRQSVKFDIYSKGGFFRSDTLIGTVNVKLQQLETKCEIHDTYNVMDGRKATGGKLEIKIRLRNPILTKQIEKIDERWLVLDI
ncbi:coiled-coil and C2 domain-containing protein 1-like [Condylostylus longicornis]|uniref:coiled-coil and C2 domain-containing protein 1-like n=1 Tax=Condylostylus longicornis TaxID=2530218 RepID=UPI00244E2EB2|nr:coiled-coil and C2 domain-containing protein 1-like [Condylostylus longicornis]